MQAEKLCHIDDRDAWTHIDFDSQCTFDVVTQKNKVYFAKYNNGTILCEPMLVDKDLLVSKLNKDDFVVSDGSIGEFLKENGVKTLNYEDNDEKLGEFLSEIVEEKLKNTKEDYNWAKVKPLYIQPPSISRPKLKNA